MHIDNSAVSDQFPSRVRKRELWPLLMIPFSFAINAEWVVPNVALHWHWVPSFPVLAMIDMFLGAFALSLWYLLLPRLWMIFEHVKIIQDIIHFFKWLKDHLSSIGTPRMVSSFFHSLASESEENKKFLNYFSQFGKGMKYVGVFFVPFTTMIPIVSWFIGGFTWFPVIVYCRTKKWPAGMFALILGDMTKNCLVSYLWWRLYH